MLNSRKKTLSIPSSWKIGNARHFLTWYSSLKSSISSYQRLDTRTFQPHHFQHPEAISDQDQDTPRLDGASWVCQHSAHISNFYHDPNSIGFTTSYQYEENKPDTPPMSLFHNVKLLCSSDREGVSNKHIPTPNIDWTSLSSADFQHWHVTTPYLYEVLTYTSNVPTMHHQHEPSSGETSQEDSTPFENKQIFWSSISDNHCGETPQHVDKSCHQSDSTSTTDGLDEPSPLDASDDHLLQLDSTSLMFNYKTPLVLNSSLFLSLKNNRTMPVLLEPHDYGLIILSQEIDTPSDNLSHQVGHRCETLYQDDPFFTHTTSLGLTFVLPHFHGTTQL